MWSNVSQYNACNVSSLSVDGRIAGVPAEFRTERRRNKSEKRCHVSQLVHWKRTRHNVGALANYWCRGKTLSITYLFVCVCERERERASVDTCLCVGVWEHRRVHALACVRAVVSSMQRVCAILWPNLWPLAPPHFSTLSYYYHRKKSRNIKCMCWFSLQFLSRIFPIQGRI